MVTVPFLIFKQPILCLAKRHAAACVVSLETNGSGGKKGEKKCKILFYTSKPLFFCLLVNSVGPWKWSQRHTKDENLLGLQF